MGEVDCEEDERGHYSHSVSEVGAYSAIGRGVQQLLC